MSNPRAAYPDQSIDAHAGFVDLLAAAPLLDFTARKSLGVLKTDRAGENLASLSAHRIFSRWRIPQRLLRFLNSLMHDKSPLAFLYVLLLTSIGALADPPITDPIADYLAMHVPDRIANVGRLLVIKKVEVDIEGTGKSNIFVGTWYRNSGPDTWLWAGYAPVAGGYHRITPPDSDVLIDFDGIYVGYLPEIGRRGMAQAYSLELTNQDRAQSNMISDITFYYIEDGRLTQNGTGALDRDDPDQEAKFEYYFGPERKLSGTPRIESMTVLELAQRGYRIPLWRSPAPPATN
jgi:hypothetical protein